jgi:hypothetical protein
LNYKITDKENIMADICRRVEVGRHGSIPETKVEWEIQDVGLGIRTKVPVLYCRTSSLYVYAEICAPEEILDQFWDDITNCALVAAGVATIAVIVASPAAALPAFEGALVPCLEEKAVERISDIGVGLSTRQQANGPWDRCS